MPAITWNNYSGALRCARVPKNSNGANAVPQIIHAFVTFRSAFSSLLILFFRTSHVSVPPITTIRPWIPNATRGLLVTTIRTSFVVSHSATPVCVTTRSHSTVRTAANLMQQVYRNITKTIQFGNVRLAWGTFRSEKHRPPTAPPVGFSCVPAQYGLPDEKIEWQDNPSGASLKKRVRVVRLKF